MQGDAIPEQDWQPVSADKKDREGVSGPSLTYAQDVWRRFKRKRTALAGAIFIAVLILTAVLVPAFSPHSYYDQDLTLANIPPILKIYRFDDTNFFYIQRNLKLYRVTEGGKLLALISPQKEDLVKKKIFFDIHGEEIHIDYGQKPIALVDAAGTRYTVYRRVLNQGYLLGTDSLGRDLFIRVLYGARISLLVAFIATLANFMIGVIYGSIAGYAGGRTDNIMMRIVDIISTIPLMLYVILIMVVLDSGFLSIVIALGSVYWVNMARVVRGQILSLKEQEFILAALTIGTSTRKILTRHLFPNAMGVIVATATLLIPQAIFIEAFLSFIGLGVSAPKASWGTLCSEALESFRSLPYQLFAPAVAICITMFAFNFLGDGLRDALDPRLRQ